jgi:2-polyprenyl-6-methoxyphenol hydroxylase-like FAD-dependent oxidoreductase
MKALIVGGGIAGPVTAMALRRVGVAATIIESHPRGDAEVGSYLTLTPNGLDALRAIDALDVAVAIGSPTRRNVMRDADWRPLGELPLGAPLDDGTAALTLKRSRLARRLLDCAVERGIPLIEGRRVVGIESAEGGVSATFDDGTTLAGDLLIGADGVHSIVRRTIDPAAPGGHYVGLTNFGGLTPASQVPAEAAAIEPETWQFGFGRSAFFGAHRLPTGDIVWFVNLPRPEIDADERARTSLADWQALLASQFDRDAGPAATLIRAGHLELAADNTYDLPRVPTWHRGRMIVIGDAAHAPSPSSGQGASMAIEDGVLLAMALRDSASIDAAFAAFESARRARVERIVAQGARSSRSKTPGRVGRAVQGIVMPLLFRFVITERALAWMYGHSIRWDRPFDQAVTTAG